MTEEAHTPKRILVVLHGAIGDVTRALPLAARIRQTWPESKISWAIEPISRELVEGHPHIDEVILFDRPRGFRAYLEFVKELRTREFDLVLDLQRHFKSGITSRLTGADRRIGFHRKNAKEFNWVFNNEHIHPVDNFSPKIEHYQRFGDLLGLNAAERLDFGLRASEEKLRVMEEFLAREFEQAGRELVPPERRVALVLGSSWKSRFWFAERYRDLIVELYERSGIVSLLVGARAEVSLAEEILEEVDDLPVVNLVSQTSLSDLRSLFSLVRFVVASDSGPMHIASAVGAPVISLWGSTSPLRSSPYGSEKYVLQSAIGCSPCYKRDCPGLNRRCMWDIPSDAVLAMAASIEQK